MPRSIMIFAALIPLAILLGVMLATPLQGTTLLLVGGSFFVLLTPLLLKSHHSLLIFSWGAFITVFFLPGQPSLWLVMALVSMIFSILTRTLNRGVVKFIHIPSLFWSLVAMGAVIVVTAQLTGGIGLRSMGSEVYGGKRYFYLLGAILFYFAMVSNSIESEKRQLYSQMFFVTGVSAIMSNITYMLGPSFYFLFLLFPAEWAMQQAYGDFAGPSMALTRISGLSPTSMAFCCFMLVKYGAAGVMNLRHPIRFLLFLSSAAVGLFSGFRSHVVLIGLIFIALFFVQKLYRTKLMPIGLVVLALGFGFLAGFADRLPLTVQRSLAVVPFLKLDPIAVLDAKVTTEWRLDLWEVVWQDIPKYLIVGKGYALDPTDIFLTEEAVRRGHINSYESSLIVGDYHNGPLTVLVTFGIFGSLAFLWVLAAGGRVLWKNYRYGDPAISNVNSFLLAYFIARTIFFFVIFGSFQTDFFLFTGVFGFSVALNKGVRTREDLEQDLLPPEDTSIEKTEEVETLPLGPRNHGLVGV